MSEISKYSTLGYMVLVSVGLFNPSPLVPFHRFIIFIYNILPYKYKIQIGSTSPNKNKLILRLDPLYSRVSYHVSNSVSDLVCLSGICHRHYLGLRGNIILSWLLLEKATYSECRSTGSNPLRLAYISQL